ncbi:hypothetical protein MVEN_00402200 [Mycena venus]|uniref:Uncharacterized protein n=1 Tax=Mycena venus TaxID=2733690 RepID=A0A8H7D7N4_9AGAR|nr:hypothetical protein MVEN_00402200 [Mycena venus]
MSYANLILHDSPSYSYPAFLNSELEWTPDMDVAGPPAYSQYHEQPPPYQQSSWDRTSYSRFDEANRQQELQLLLSVLFSITLTLLLMDAVPILGEPTSSIPLHVLRVYSWFTLALFISLLLALCSLLCKAWLSLNHPDFILYTTPDETRFRVSAESLMTRLIASGPGLMYAMTICAGIGFADFFWQLYPALVTTGGIYGTTYVLASSLTTRPFKEAYGRTSELEGPRVVAVCACMVNSRYFADGWAYAAYGTWVGRRM